MSASEKVRDSYANLLTVAMQRWISSLPRPLASSSLHIHQVIDRYGTACILHHAVTKDIYILIQQQLECDVRAYRP